MNESEAEEVGERGNFNSSQAIAGKKRKRFGGEQEGQQQNSLPFSSSSSLNNAKRQKDQNNEEVHTFQTIQGACILGQPKSKQPIFSQHQQQKQAAGIENNNNGDGGNMVLAAAAAAPGGVHSLTSASRVSGPSAIPIPAASVLRNLNSAKINLQQAKPPLLDENETFLSTKEEDNHSTSQGQRKRPPRRKSSDTSNSNSDENTNDTDITRTSAVEEATISKLQNKVQGNTNMDRMIEEVDRRYYQVAILGFIVWIVLSLLSFYIASTTGNLEKLSGVEEKAPLVASMLLGMSLFSCTLPLFIKKLGFGVGSGNQGRGLHSAPMELSGIMACSIVVHLVAFVTDLLMATFPTPVFLDPVSGTKVYLLRWCEWTPLAFVMTFVTEACRHEDHDDDDNDGLEESCLGSSKLSRFLSILRFFFQKSCSAPEANNGNDSESSEERVENEIDNTSEGDALQSDRDYNNEHISIERIGKELRPAYILASTQGASTLCGWFFPFCPNKVVWMGVLCISCIFYFMIFIRCHRRSVAFQAIKMKPLRANARISILHQEFYQWAELSLKLLKTCRNMWTVLVIAYFVYTLGPFFFPRNQFLHMRGLTMICESIIDVLFKSVYMMVILDVHHAIFDQNTRVERRLEEMRKMMGVVWDNSSDVICISVRNANGNVTTMLSPTFLKICSSLEADERVDGHDRKQGERRVSLGDVMGVGKLEATQNAKAIAFELDAKLFQKGNGSSMVSHIENIKPRIMYNVNLNDLMNQSENDRRATYSQSGSRKTRMRKTSKSKMEEVNSTSEYIISMARLVVRAWNTSKDVNMIMHELVRTKKKKKRRSNSEEGMNDNDQRRRDQTGIRFEANLTRMENDAMLIVVRDISERVKRFEAEKKVISETTARRKDAAANRFTRHEVKNGLLAAIGLCDSLREAEDKDNGFVRSHKSLEAMVGRSKRHVLQRGRNASFTLLPSASNSANTSNGHNPRRYLFELDKTLHEILDTVLAEAMARDVIHEVYEPKLERVDVAKLLYNTISVPASSSKEDIKSASRNNKRFPIVTIPSSLPKYALDPQLLKCIHRNAISNACKYGKRGGVIRTEVIWDKNAGILRMDVINLPGPCHTDILRLGSLASEIVFSPRKRLTVHSSTECNDHVATHSSGDGAWIMNKCAKTLGGNCEIKFEPHSTTFTFSCPVMPYHEMLATANIHHEGFEMPKNVWGIALDDSKIQRKLLVRFFMHVGIPENHIHIFGASASEIKGFDRWAVSFIDSHPNDYFLMIIDENLDVQEENTTISGSLAVSDMRRRLLSDQERRVLALIRSANDSASDVAIYRARAHGFLPKAPIKKEAVREVLVPMWLKRFPRFENNMKKKTMRTTPIEDMEGEVVIAMEDLTPCIEDIDHFATLCDANLEDKWNIIWEKLHALKGDLLIMPSHATLTEAIRLITSLRGPVPPNQFYAKWQSIKSLLQSYQIASLEGKLVNAHF